MLPQKWDHKEEQQQKPIQQKVNGAKVIIFLSKVQSVKKLHEDLEALLSSVESPINATCLTETWLNETDDFRFKLKGFHTILTKN